MAIPIVGVAILCAFGWILFRHHDDGNAIQSARTELVQARYEQQQARALVNTIEQRLVRSAEIIGEVETRIESVENRNGTAQEIIRENRRIIAESRNILEQIRKASEEKRTTK